MLHETHETHETAVIKRYARFILAMFVVSVLNVSMQLPVHAAMQMQMQQSNMQQIPDCHCPPAICDSVLALDNQSVGGVAPVQTGNNRLLVLLEVLDQNPGGLNRIQHVNRILLNASQASPPTLLIKTLLLI